MKPPSEMARSGRGFRGTSVSNPVADDWTPRVQLSLDGAPPRFASVRSPGALAWLAARPWQGGSLLTGLTLAAICLAWLSWPKPIPVALPLPSRAPELPVPPAPVRYADGSQAQLHGERSALFTEEESGERVRVRLVGGARFDVVANRARSFVVANGQVVVRVLGTAFSVDPDGVRTRVAVERGRVQVIWRSGAAILSAGEVAVFPPANEPAFVPASVYDSPLSAQAPKKKSKPRRRHRAHAR